MYILIVGMGRSGTHYMSELFGFFTDKSFHLDDISNAAHDSFYCYSAWYGLPIDTAPLINHRSNYLSTESISEVTVVESNPYMLPLISVFQRGLGAKILLVFRNPLDVIASHMAKGWYEESEQFSESEGVPGPRYNREIHYGLGRITSRKLGSDIWDKLSRIEKISHIWVEYYEDALRQSNLFILNIQDVNYERCLELSDIFGLSREALNLRAYNKLVRRKPGKGKKRYILREDETKIISAITDNTFKKLQESKYRWKS